MPTQFMAAVAVAVLLLIAIQTCHCQTNPDPDEQCKVCEGSGGTCFYDGPDLSSFSCHCNGVSEPQTCPSRSPPPTENTGHNATSFGKHNEQYTNCSNLAQCGNFPVLGYPFWGGNRPDYCGHPSFQTSCRGNSPIINIRETPYRVLAVNDTAKTMTVVGEDFQDRRFCSSSPQNITLDKEHFEYAPGFQDLLLYYGCRAQGNVPILTQFPCSSLGDNTFAVYTADVLGNSFERACGPSISVRINGTLAQGLQSSARNAVNITQVLDNGFGLVWKANNMECDVCRLSGGRCGSDSGSFTCYCRDGAYPVTCDSIQSSPGTNKRKNWLIVTIACVASALGVGILVICLIMCWRRRISNDPSLEDLIKKHGCMALKRYSYSNIKKMTNSFKDKLGRGGFGSVYKGKLPDGHVVAVKILNVLKGNCEDFINEVASISRTSHVNVVTLQGYCLQGNKRALVYDLMPHGSLEKFICNKSNGEVGLARLDWETLYKITVGIARGLEYLHSGCNTRILHFDIKPHNILLDEDFCPKISDFGLAKLCTRKESIVSMVGARGTVGYIAPEVFCRNFGGVSYKSDVYSYGMMVLEMVGARKKVVDHQVGSSIRSECYFPQWIYKRLEAGEDLELQGDMTEVENEITKKMTMVGLWCIQTDPSHRPSMGRVLEMLEGSIGGLELPPQPFLISPSTPMAEYSTTLTVS